MSRIPPENPPESDPPPNPSETGNTIPAEKGTLEDPKERVQITNKCDKAVDMTYVGLAFVQNGHDKSEFEKFVKLDGAGISSDVVTSLAAKAHFVVCDPKVVWCRLTP